MKFIKKILRKIMSQQNYEEYWKLTNAFTDYNGKKFLDTLAVCINFIDEFRDEPYSEEKYSRLQLEVEKVNPINLISIRKSINQLVKMGFINSFLLSYHPQAKEYVEARTNKKRETLLSKIIYSNSSFNRAVNNESSIKQINFLIQTLIEKGKLSKEEIIALMLVDIEKHKRPFITEIELQEYVAEARKIGFIERKYNQVGYLYNILGKLDDLVFINDDLYFKEDAQQIFGEDLTTTKKRDPYLHRLYKNQLQEECEEVYGKPLCVLEKLAYPVLIASHIKPFIQSDETEAYDPNNGLLLSRTMDSLFDLKYISFTDEGKMISSHIKPFIQSDETEAYDPNNGLLLSRTMDSLFDLKYISFTDEGKMIFSKRISDDVKEFWKDYHLEPTILNDKRKNYLAFHRNLMTSIDKILN
jgi:predicted restriction endonuclease